MKKKILVTILLSTIMSIYIPLYGHAAKADEASITRPKVSAVDDVDIGLYEGIEEALMDILLDIEVNEVPSEIALVEYFEISAINSVLSYLTAEVKIGERLLIVDLTGKDKINWVAYAVKEDFGDESRYYYIDENLPIAKSTNVYEFNSSDLVSPQLPNTNYNDMYINAWVDTSFGDYYISWALKHDTLLMSFEIDTDITVDKAESLLVDILESQNLINSTKLLSYCDSYIESIELVYRSEKQHLIMDIRLDIDTDGKYVISSVDIAGEYEHLFSIALNNLSNVN